MTGPMQFAGREDVPGFREVDALEESLNVCVGVEGDAHATDLATCHHVVAVVADLRRQVEGDRHAAGAPFSSRKR